MMMKLSGLTIALLCAALFVGCSSNDDADEAGSTAGTGAAGTGTAGTGTAGTSAGSGGTAGTGTAGTGIALTCDETIPSVTSCGSETCEAVSEQAAMLCQVSCCTADDKCGTRNTSSEAAGFLGTCMATAEEDPTCPGQEVMFAGNSFDLPGCRLPSGSCGVLAQFIGCIDPCDAPGAGADCDADGGV